MDILEVSYSCDYSDACDPFICITHNGTRDCSGHCVDSDLCDYSTGQYPFIIEYMTESDFTGGLSIEVWDFNDVLSNTLIWSGSPVWNAPLVRWQQSYGWDKSAAPSQAVPQLWFTLEGM